VLRSNVNYFSSGWMGQKYSRKI